MNGDMQMTIWGLVREASVVVQCVMAALVLASMLSWYLIVWRSQVLGRAARVAREVLRQFRAQSDPTHLTGAEQAVHGLAAIQHAGVLAFRQFSAQAPDRPQLVLDGVERALLSSIAEQEQELEKALPILATIGSVSPYVGLFGTVWGIMTAFLGLSQVEQATLSTVAPGIAEALIATAIGLFAAIPAVVAYNRFSAGSQALLGRYYGFANELQGRLQRQLMAVPGLKEETHA